MKTQRTLLWAAAGSILLSSIADAQLLPTDDRWVEATLSSLTLDQRLGQLFIPVHRSVDSTAAMIREFHIGGIWFAWHDARRVGRN